MSNMVEKLEQEVSSGSDNRAKCNYNWFLENMIERPVTVERDKFGPTQIKIYRRIAKKTELWNRIAMLKGGDMQFEMVASYPTEKENE